MSRSTCQRWHELSPWLDQLLEMPPDARAGWLDGLALDAELKASLHQALSHAETPHLLLDSELSAAALLTARDSAIEHWLGKHIGRWRITGLLGQGGMATVFSAERIEPPLQDGALKLMQYGLFTEAGRTQFLREQSILARLEHPGIARLIDAGLSDDGIPYLVMEPVSGIAIDRHAREAGLGLHERMQLIARAGDILAYAQRSLIVHRDLKPEHILVTADGALKLLDFGIAKLVDDEHCTRTGLQLGTPRYSAPEQVAGHDVSTATDVYSLGRIAEELAHDGGTRVPRDLQAILAQACAESPENRYPSAAELVADLRRWLANHPVHARRIGTLAKTMKMLRRHWIPATALAAIVLSLLLGVVAANREAARADRAALAAETARQHADRALARERALNRFVVGLFEADIADVPRDQMPSVRQIVDAGIAKARDPASGSAELRGEMLLTLARVVMSRAQFDEAVTLSGETIALLEPVAVQFPELYAEALLTRGDIEGMHKQDEAAADWSRRAADWSRQHLPGSRKDFEARRNVARFDQRLGKHAEARQALEALDRDLAKHAQFTDIRLKVSTDLAIAYANDGDMPRAAQAFDTVLEIKRGITGTSPDSIVSAMFNVASVRSLLGQFDASDHMLGEAMDMVADVDAPALQTRAALWQAKSDNARRRGRFDEAEKLIETAAGHWATALQRSPDSDWFLPLHRGTIRAAAGRTTQALADLADADQRLHAASRPPRRILEQLQRTQARVLCQSGDSNAGMARLGDLPHAAMDSRAAQGWEAREAVATCLFAAGRPADAAGWLGDGALTEHPLVIGDNAVLARRLLLRARARAALGNLDGARDDLDAAQRGMDAIGVEATHPLRGGIAELRRQVATNS